MRLLFAGYTLSHTDFIGFQKKYKFAIPLTWEFPRRLNNLFTSLLNRNPSISPESEGERQPPPSPFLARRLTTGCCFPRELFLSNFVKFPWDLLKENKTYKLKEAYWTLDFQKSPLSDLHSWGRLVASLIEPLKKSQETNSWVWFSDHDGICYF